MDLRSGRLRFDGRIHYCSRIFLLLLSEPKIAQAIESFTIEQSKYKLNFI